MTYKTVGYSDYDPGISFNWDPTNGNTTTTLKWKSDDITDANRTAFEKLTKSQRKILLSSGTKINSYKFGIRATNSVKRQLKEYEKELSGENDTVLAYNGFWNIEGNDFLNGLGYDLEINPFEVENNNLLSFADAMKLSGEVSPIGLVSDDDDDVGDGDTGNTLDNNSLVTIVDGKNLLGEADLEFELTDSLIESLTNLKYPEDALYNGNVHAQDYIKIKQWKYQAPTKDLITGGQGSVDIGLGTGLIRKTARKQQLGLIRLPMPNQIQDSNNVSWGPDQISNITAAAAAGVLPLVNSENINNLINKPIATMEAMSKAAGPRSKKFLGNLANALKNAQGGAGAQALIGSKLLNMAGLDVSAESLLARGQGVIPNNNMELLFNAPTLREFQFNWKMSPRSETEAAVVNQIIKFFKAGMAVKKQSNTGSGTGASYFLGTPNVFDVQFITTGNEQIDGLMRIKECACTGCAVNYTPESNWAAYEDGQPVSVIMTLKFSELEPIYDIDYLENKPEQYKKENQVDDIPATAIGY